MKFVIFRWAEFLDIVRYMWPMVYRLTCLDSSTFYSSELLASSLALFPCEQSQNFLKVLEKVENKQEKSGKMAWILGIQ